MGQARFSRLRAWREPKSCAALRARVRRRQSRTRHSNYTIVGFWRRLDFEAIQNRFRLPGGINALEFVPATGVRAHGCHIVDNAGKQLDVLELVTFEPSTIDLRSSVGEYRSLEIDVTYTVALEGSGLAVRPPGGAHIVLQPVAKDVFAGDSVGTVKFLRDARGAVSGFTVNRDKARGIRFDRVKPAG